jgi:hypothetical protein
LNAPHVRAGRYGKERRDFKACLSVPLRQAAIQARSAVPGDKLAKTPGARLRR